MNKPLFRMPSKKLRDVMSEHLGGTTRYCGSSAGEWNEIIHGYILPNGVYALECLKPKNEFECDCIVMFDGDEGFADNWQKITTNPVDFTIGQVDIDLNAMYMNYNKEYVKSGKDFINEYLYCAAIAIRNGKELPIDKWLQKRILMQVVENEDGKWVQA